MSLARLYAPLENYAKTLAARPSNIPAGKQFFQVSNFSFKATMGKGSIFLKVEGDNQRYMGVLTVALGAAAFGVINLGRLATGSGKNEQ